jgi:hypothetical protein
MSSSIEKSDVLTFLGGAAAAVAAIKFFKSRAAHKIAVNTVAGVMKVQDKATEGFERVYEEAQDVYAEAKAKAAASAKQDAGTQPDEPKEADAE